MPICQECQTPYDEWQHFCLQCGKYLKEGPPPLLRCPKCGTGLETVSGFDQESAAPVQEIDAPLKASASWKWMGAIALLVLGIIFFSRLGSDLARWVKPTPRTEIVEKASPQGGKEGKAPSTVDPHLQPEVAKVFTNIREANLKKNILLFMDTLSGSYPELDKKRQEVVKTWKKFDFSDMTFTIDKLEGIDSDKALAEVKWILTRQNLATKDWRTEEFQYRVWLANELGQWKIKKIQQIPQ